MKNLGMLIPGIAAICFNAFGQKTAKPNILFIIADDLQIESTDPRFQGQQSIDYFNEANDRPYTPRLDSLADAGLEFVRAYSSSTICTPARYTNLTGRYAGHNKSHDYLDSRDDNMLAGEKNFVPRIDLINTAMESGSETHAGMNVQTLLGKAGYMTGLVGKWHLGPHVHNTSQAWSAVGWKKYDRSADPALNSTVNQQMKQNQRVLQDIMKGYGWDIARNVYLANTKELENDRLDVHNIEWTVKGAFEIMDSAMAAGKPFFLHFGTTLHHGPDPWSNNHASSTNADIRYAGDGWYPEGVKYDGRNVMPSRKDIVAEVVRAGKKPEDAWTALLDKGVGALLNRLEELKLSENTMVIFTSDHGFERYGKASLLEGGVRVPLFITWKDKIPPNSKIDQLVQNIDYAPTFYHYAGILNSLPRGYLMNGKSLHPYIETQDNRIVLHDHLYAEVGFARSVITKTNKYIAIRYPNKINRQIKDGHAWAPFMEGDPPLTQPYLLTNSHLGHWSSTFNTQYWNLDQYYDYRTDREDYVNLLYKDNRTPLPEVNIPAHVRAGRDSLRKILSGYLAQFEGTYFGEFHDGSTVGHATKDATSHPRRAELHFNGNALAVSGPPVSTLQLFDIRGKLLKTLHPGGRLEVPWDGTDTHGIPVSPGIYHATLSNGTTTHHARFVIGMQR